MKRYVRIKEGDIYPQYCGIYAGNNYYRPVFLHTTIDQDRPVGSHATFRQHIHNFYHLVLYTQGQGEYFHLGRYFPATPGTCVLISPGQRHDFISRRKTAVYSELTFSYVNQEDQPLTLSFEKVLGLYSGLKVSLPENLRFSTEDRQSLQSFLNQLIDYLNSGRELSTYYAHRILGQIFDSLIGHRADTTQSEPIDDRFLRARMWIEKHCLENFPIQEPAKCAGVSEGYFFRAFKKCFGMTPVHYQQQLRIEAAKTLLKATSLKCNEISFRVGFSDVYYFHRVFKKHTGMTPKNYRRSPLFPVSKDEGAHWNSKPRIS